MSRMRLFAFIPGALALALLMAGCGNGDSAVASAAGNSGTVIATGANAARADSFLSQVIAVIGASSDTAEPRAIDTVTPTTPKNAEPIPVS